MTTSWMILMIENYVDFIFSYQTLHNCFCQYIFKMKLFPKWSLLCLQCKVNVLTSHIYDMWKCECKYFDQIKIQCFFTLPQKMFIVIDVRVCELHYLYVQVKMEIYRKVKCNEFGHVGIDDLQIHDYAWPFTCYL